MVKVRVMTVNDWDGVNECWKEHEGTNPVDDSPEGFARYLGRNPATSFVAEENGRITYTIPEAPDRRGQGIGRMLVESAMEALRKEGIQKVLLVVFTHNENGNRFWEHMGFTVREDLYYRNKYIEI